MSELPNLDTQPTLPWVGEGSQNSPGKVPATTLGNILVLPGDKLGEVLFFPIDSVVLSQGAAACREYFMNDFAEPDNFDMLTGDASGSIRRALEMTRDFIRDVNKSIAIMHKYQSSYEHSKSSAKGAAHLILVQAEAETGEQAKKKKQMAEIWLANEIKSIDARTEYMVSNAKRRCVTAGKKLDALWSHLAEHSLLSSDFRARLENWKELDDTQLLAAKIRAQGDGCGDTVAMLKQSSKIVPGAADGPLQQPEQLQDTLVEEATQASADTQPEPTPDKPPAADLQPRMDAANPNQAQDEERPANLLDIQQGEKHAQLAEKQPAGTQIQQGEKCADPTNQPVDPTQSQQGEKAADPTNQPVDPTQSQQG